MKRALGLTISLALAACGGAMPPDRTAAALSPAAVRPASVLRGAVIGFSVDSPARAAIAARQGVTSTILYGSAPPRGSALARALAAHRISAIDGGVSSLLYEWECYRTLTVKPPPHGYAWCGSGAGAIASTAELLRRVKLLAAKDARLPYVSGYWVLDDWPWWDYGSAHGVLPLVHAALAAATPGLPAICGFGATVGRPGQAMFDPGLARNYSNAGCDAVGWYNYSEFGIKHPWSGRDLDWSMKALLPAMARGLAHYGWKIADTPLIGIAQGWAGSYGGKYYQADLTVAQMRAQAAGFCGFGASSISWYAWNDSGFESRTQTPSNSPVIAAGIRAGIDACKAIWATASAKR